MPKNGSKRRISKKKSKISRSGRKSRKNSRRIRRRSGSKLAIPIIIAAAAGSAYAYKKYRDSTYKIEVMADVEGCWNKVISFLEKSDIFTLKDGSKITRSNFTFVRNFPEHLDIKMKGNCKFVCMGDTIDNGPNYSHVLRFLMYLKKEYKERVVLILGNRDINKLRLLFEFDKIRPVYNIPAKHQELIDLYDQKNKETTKLKKEEIDYKILEYLFKNTFGIRGYLGPSNDLFKNTVPMQSLQNTYPDTKEHEIVSTYKFILNEYLKFILLNGELIHYDSKTRSIFVHGSVNCTNWLLNYEEHLEGKTTKYNSVTEWVKNLNKWGNDMIKLAYTVKDESVIEPLIKYQEPNSDGTDVIESVVHARPWIDFGKDTIDIRSTLSDECKTEVSKDIDFIVFSHSPVGQIPLIIKDDPITLVACDTTQAGRIANITISKNLVSVKADFQKGNPPINNLCNVITDELEQIEYSSDDPRVGNIEDGKLVVSDNIVITKWNKQGPSPTYNL